MVWELIWAMTALVFHRGKRSDMDTSGTLMLKGMELLSGLNLFEGITTSVWKAGALRAIIPVWNRNKRSNITKRK
jgi:hypothetical protein